jgi:hypothetical protein
MLLFSIKITLKLFKTCKKALKPNGICVMKDNVSKLVVEFDKIDDHSINSNDSTPTLGGNLKESRFLNTETINTNSNLNKAKDAVFRASLFCDQLNKINQQSKS